MIYVCNRCGYEYNTEKSPWVPGSERKVVAFDDECPSCHKRVLFMAKRPDLGIVDVDQGDENAS